MYEMRPPHLFRVPRSHSDKTPWEKDVARNHVEKGCWCIYRSNMNPAFRDWKPPPPVRTEEEFKARESKGLVAFKKAVKAGSIKSVRTSASKAMEDTSFLSMADPGPDMPDDDFVGSSSLRPHSVWGQR